MPRLKESQRTKGQRGVALIMALLLIALVGTVVADFQYSSQVGYQLAINSRDQLQAEYNALSAMRLRALILKQSGKLKSALLPLMGLLAGSGAGAAGSSLSMIPQLLEMLPVECGLMGAMLRKTEDIEPLEGETGERNSLFIGDCMAVSVSEHSKLSLIHI